MSPGTIIVGLVLLFGVILAIRSVIRQHKSGGCSGGCESCSGCDHGCQENSSHHLT